MTQVVSSISGLQVYAPSAGFAPTNSADVSAIASGYQVVSATSTELYAGTAFLTGVNGAPVSASRAGQAANASMANSAYYDGTGRLISSLPDSSDVSAIASSYAESAVSSKLDESATADFYSTSNPSSFVGSAYVDSAVSGKQDTLTFAWDSDSAISSINGSALAGQGGVAITAISYDTATQETSVVTATGLGIANHTTNPRVSSFKFSDDSYRPIEASSLAAGATQTGKNGFVTYTLKLSPSASMWTTSDVATGIFYPLQWGTGAGVFMDAGNFKGHMKGNEIFVSNTAQKRAANLEVNHLGLSSNNGSSQANLRDYVLSIVDSANSTATLGRYWLSFSSTASGNAMYAINYIKLYDTAESATKTISSTSIDYWNGKADGSSLSSYALSADVSSVIDTVSSNSANWGQGGVDSATVSSIASSYAESATSGKQDASAMTAYQPAGDYQPSGDYIYVSALGWAEV